MADGNALDGSLRFAGFRHHDRKHAILEACRYLVVFGLETECDAPLEATITAFGEVPIIVLDLGMFLTANGQYIAFQQDFV